MSSSASRIIMSRSGGCESDSEAELANLNVRELDLVALEVSEIFAENKSVSPSKKFELIDRVRPFADFGKFDLQVGPLIEQINRISVSS